MAYDIDKLSIQIQAQSTNASKQLEKLAVGFDQLATSLDRIGVGKLDSLSSSLVQLSNSLSAIKNVGRWDFTRIAKGIQSISAVESKDVRQASTNLLRLSKALKELGNTKVSDSSKQIAELSTSLSKLGYKTTTQAITNIPKLAVALKEMMETLSKAPLVNKNLIQMTSALANLSRQGSTMGRATASISSSMNSFSRTTTNATRKSFSLASSIGKLYATYWLLFRAFHKLKEAVDISSQLTEVQNVVDTTFGKYSDLVESLADVSISEFGMSKLTVKQISSRFQAMGTAMGISQKEMANYSIELTKLAGDMASFYDVEQTEVAQALQSGIMAGQTRPLRQYGLDLTEATLKAWALKQGIDADIDSMTQQEKTMLRYNYVMANTSAAQGDFAKTSTSWANSVRQLSQNFQQFGATIGGIITNAFKPFVVALNQIMIRLNDFAIVVSNALGKIFGWEYQVGGGGIVGDLEDAEDSAGGLDDNLGSAVGNAKRLKQQLAGFDKLNNLTTPTSGNGSGGGSGASGGNAETVSGGQWVNTEPIWKKYESDIDSLYKLGERINDALISSMRKVDWDSVYETASNFGRGLATFLNGLISPDLFSEVGKSIANSLRTALIGLDSFAVTFNFENFGKSITSGIASFFDNFPYEELSSAFSHFASGMFDFMTGALEGINWRNLPSAIIEHLVEYFNGIDYEEEFKAIGKFIATAICSGIDLVQGIADAVGDIGAKIRDYFVSKIEDAGFSEDKGFIDNGKAIVQGIYNGIVEELGDIKTWIENNIVKPFKDGFSEKFTYSEVFGDNEAFTTFVNKLNGVKDDVEKVVDKIKDKIQEIKDVFQPMFDEIDRIFTDVYDTHIKPSLDFLKDNVLPTIKSLLADLNDKVIKPLSDFLNKYIAPALKSIKDALSPIIQAVKDFVKEKLSDTIQKVSDVLGWLYDHVLSPLATLLGGALKIAFTNISNVVSTFITIISKVIEVVSGVLDTLSAFGEKIKSVKSGIEESLGAMKGKLDDFINNLKTKWSNSAFGKAIGSIKDALSTKWTEAKSWWDNHKPTLSSVTATVSNIANTLKSAWNTAVTWWNNHKPSLSSITANIKVPHISVDWDTSSAIGKAMKALGLKGKPTFNVAYYKNGGFPEDGWFRASHGEYMGKFDNGTSVIANNRQIISGIANGVKEANMEQNRLLREQNQLLMQLLAKDTSISSRDLFNAVRQEDNSYTNRNGHSAFAY